MNVRLIAVGKIRQPYIADALADFRKRLKPYHVLQETAVKAADGSNPARAIVDESQRILKLLEGGDEVWLLERGGTALSSEALSRKIAVLEDSGAKSLTLVIAGTYGAAADLQKRAQFHWSLSSLTFLHEWARAIVLEQLYRAAKIARNEPYHH